MNSLGLAEHKDDWECKASGSCPHNDDFSCSGCEYLVIRCYPSCPRRAQDNLLEHLRILLKLHLPLSRIDTNPDGTYEDGFVDGKVAQLEHDMETINKILEESNDKSNDKSND